MENIIELLPLLIVGLIIIVLFVVMCILLKVLKKVKKADISLKEDQVEEKEIEQDVVQEEAEVTPSQEVEEVVEENIQQEETTESSQEVEVIQEEVNNEAIEDTPIEEVKEESNKEYPLEVVNKESKNDANDDEDQQDIEILKIDEDTGEVISIKYALSYAAKLTRAYKITKFYYQEIKNYLMRYQEVKSRISWRHETINVGRTRIAEFLMRGENLVIFLNLDPNDYVDPKYTIQDASKFKAHSVTPLCFKVNGDRKFIYALSLLDDLINKFQLTPIEDYQKVNYVEQYQYLGLQELVNKGLVRESGFIEKDEEAEEEIERLEDELKKIKEIIKQEEETNYDGVFDENKNIKSNVLDGINLDEIQDLLINDILGEEDEEFTSEE